jgi:glycosyltransferase involved in cell wall biosynthesis
MDSVCGQTYSYLECIVVDDFSTDNTEKVVKEMMLKDSRIRYIRNQRNKGAQGARNTGLLEAKGDLIQFLDSDDCIHPKKIDRQFSMFQDNNSLDMVSCLDEYFRKTPSDESILWNLPNAAPDIDRFLYDDASFHTSSPLWLKTSIERLQLSWDERLICWQDWDFHLQALIKGIQYKTIPVVLNYIRDHQEERISNSETLAKVESKLIAAENVTNELIHHKTLTDQRIQYLLHFVYNILSVILLSDERNDYTLGNRANKLFFKLVGLTNQFKQKGFIARFVAYFPKLLFVKNVRNRYLSLLYQSFNIQQFPSGTWKQFDSIAYRL